MLHVMPTVIFHSSDLFVYISSQIRSRNPTRHRSMYQMKMSFLLFLFVHLPFVLADLHVGFYRSSCPQAESIVQQVVQNEFCRDPSIIAALLRMHFHDCFDRVSINIYIYIYIYIYINSYSNPLSIVKLILLFFIFTFTNRIYY